MIAAGGTGGHIFPALALGQALAKYYPGVDFRYLCGERELEQRIYHENGADPIVFPARQLGSGVVGRLKGGIDLAGAMGRAIALIRREKFNAVAGMGGYVSGPAMAAGILLRRITALHEANSIPGRTNKLLAPHVSLCAVHFEATLRQLRCGTRGLRVGMPIREEITQGSRDEAIQIYQLNPEKRTVLVLGGSQGAKPLYEKLLDALPLIDQAKHGDVQFLWSTGAGNYDQMLEAAKALSVRHIAIKLVPFVERMDAALAVADAAVARAGASSIAELLACGVFALYVPFPFAIYDHQTTNAREVERAGAGTTMAEREMTRDRTAAAIEALLSRTTRGARIQTPPSLDSRAAARSFAAALVTKIG